jgi:hypothetical protein
LGNKGMTLGYNNPPSIEKSIDDHNSRVHL